ncbi:MAG: alpha/beta fold hydrolase [Actinomycetota bacterium]|nr:alpha/beta fold hydrolase [Actinomycetota bacterium]
MASASESRVSASEEQFAAVSAGVDLCYQTFGDPADEPLLLVMGLGGPMTWWDPDFCALLAENGFYVIRYDNRDVGRSTRMKGRINRRTIASSFAGVKAKTPYTLQDMADDALALLDHLGLTSAHVVGISMGGMIVQTMALSHPDRVRSMTSIMSTTGRRSVGWQDPRLLPLLMARRSQSREHYINASSRLWKLIGSPLYPDTTETVRERAAETWDRGVSAAGVARQIGAILTQPDRSLALRSLRIPSLVIHGLSDRMVHVSGGRATSSSISGSELLLIDGMGHDVPRDLHGTFVDAIRRTADRSRQ